MAKYSSLKRNQEAFKLSVCLPNIMYSGLSLLVFIFATLHFIRLEANLTSITSYLGIGTIVSVVQPYSNYYHLITIYSLNFLVIYSFIN